MSARLAELARAIDARLVGADRDYAGAAIDSRRLAPGTLFFALPGARVNGHAFVADAAARGAAAAVVTREQDAGLAQLVVVDVAAALARAGAFARARFAGRVAAITGSNGKTTVKQMLAAIAGQAGSAAATRGNYNNELGVPLTLLGLVDERIAVIEMGAAGPGDIAKLAALARPQVGLVTNAGRAHLAGFGDVAGVARAKGELFAHLADDGIAVINADDAHADVWRERAGGRRRVEFGLSDGADVGANDIRATRAGSRFTLATPAGSATVVLALAGRHNVANALAAAAAAHALGIAPTAIARGLAQTRGVGSRLQVVSGRAGARLIDDSYNANPDSAAAALDWLAGEPGPRWLVLGAMAELGDTAADAHAEIGARATRAGVERLWTAGDLAGRAGTDFAGRHAHYPRTAELAPALAAALDAAPAPPIVLVKGSRSAAMEAVVAALAAGASAQEGASC